MATVDDLEEGDLRIARKVSILQISLGFHQKLDYVLRILHIECYDPNHRIVDELHLSLLESSNLAASCPISTHFYTYSCFCILSDIAIKRL